MSPAPRLGYCLCPAALAVSGARPGGRAAGARARGARAATRSDSGRCADRGNPDQTAGRKCWRADNGGGRLIAGNERSGPESP
jgi:hypothetical protein